MQKKTYTKKKKKERNYFRKRVQAKGNRVDVVKGLALRKMSRVMTEVMDLCCLLVPLLLAVSQDSKSS